MFELLKRMCVATQRLLLSGGVVCLLSIFAISRAADSVTVLDLLKKADSVKTSSYADFGQLMGQIDGMENTMSLTERLYLRYLKGWQAAYVGDYGTAVPILESTISESDDAVLKLRARATMVNVLSIAKNHEKAFAQLSQMLEALPGVSDAEAREQAIRVAALLYNQVGQQDLAFSYAQKMHVSSPNGRDACTAQELMLRIVASRDIGSVQWVGSEFEAGIGVCRRAGEMVFANLIETYVAKVYFAQGKHYDAIKLLNERYDEVVKTKYPPLVAGFESLLAQAYRETGNTDMARRFALRAVDSSKINDYRESSVNAYRLLYLIAKEQGDARSALIYHEKYMVADKGYLDDITARQLAYQRVKHEVDAGKLQIDGLNKQNKVLQLQRQLDDKAMENVRLYIALLTSVLVIIAVWAYKTKRSQQHFRKLSRRDGLTGIFNRPHFIELAEATLNEARKSQQDVCVVLCDLDHFKSVNDNYGHAEGDYVLQRAVAACQAHLRATDVFARIGGEEFGVLLPSCSMEEARKRAEQMRVAVAESHQQDGKFQVSASFGIAAANSSGYELKVLMTHADSALYQAKRAGRNRVVAYDVKIQMEKARSNAPSPSDGLSQSPA